MNAVLGLPAINVAEWAQDEEYPFFPEGSRDKRLLRCPNPAPAENFIAEHRYLFKKSRLTYPEQFWVEVVAYRLGLLVGIHVPPACAAWDSNTGDCAALIEWFYGFPGRPEDQFLSGGMFMKSIIPDYDLKRGKQHNFQSIEAWCRLLLNLQNDTFSFDAGWLIEWARILAFDALIGNTDRHHENWGFLVTRAPDQSNTVQRMHLAPAFDNGTSLGHERPTSQFGRFDDANYLRRYIERGRHHMKWQESDGRQAGHAELLLKICQKHPQCRPAMLSVLGFDASALEATLQELTRLVLPIRLSADRVQFMLRLVLARREYLLQALTSP